MHGTMMRSVFRSLVQAPIGVKRSSAHSGIVFRAMSSTSQPIARPSKKVDPNSFRGKIKSYAELSKFRLSSMVVFTSGAGFICAGLPLDYAAMASVCAGTMLCAASAGTFNQIFEREQDSRMKRTLTRPLPSGNVTPTEAAVWGVSTGAAGTALLLSATNPVVAALGLANIGLYAGAYTYSKRFTELNTWIGAVVGAIPPVMGWAAATGGQLIAPEPAALAALLFLWQFPHFFALSYLHREDYARGNFEMVAVNDPNGIRSANLILQYSALLTILPIACSVGGVTSYMFALEGTAANMYLLYLAQKFRSDRTNAGAKRIFLCSLWYLPLLLTGFVFHAHVWDRDTIKEGETVDELAEVMAGAKATMKGLCIHEKMHSTPALCPKMATDKAVDSAVQGVGQVAEQAVAVSKGTSIPIVLTASTAAQEQQEK